MERHVFQHLKTVARGTPLPPPEEKPTRPSLGTFGRYVLLSVLGEGACGVVYRARDTHLDRTVALKKVINLGRRDAKPRFLREARTAAQLKHPNIVSVYDVGEIDDQMYITMELVDGTTLEKAATNLPPKRKMEIVRDVALALQFAHDRGIVHRDVKPGNILLSADGRPFVADFGLARNLNPDAKLTASNEIVGTPAYLSPEQAAGDALDTRTDVYSLGVVLYQIVAGRLPHLEAPLYEHLRAIIETEPPSPRSVDASIDRDLEAVILKAMEKDKRRRYPRAADLAADLDAVLRGAPVSARRSGLLRQIRCKARSAALVGGAVLVVAAGLAAWKGWLRRPGVPPPPVVPAKDPEKALRLTNEAERRMGDAIREGQKKSRAEFAATLDDVEKLLREALAESEVLVQPYFELSRCQALRGDYRKALLTHLEMWRKATKIPEERALVEEGQVRLLLVAAESLPVAGSFDLRSLTEAVEFPAFLERLKKRIAHRPNDSARWASLSSAFEKAAQGDRAGALDAAKKVDENERESRDEHGVGPALLALLTPTQGDIPSAKDVGDPRIKPVLNLVTSTWQVRAGAAVPAEKGLERLVESTVVAPPTGYYLLAHAALAKEDPAAAEKHLSRCVPSVSQAHAIDYLRAILAVPKDPKRAIELLERVVKTDPDLLEAEYHLAAALAHPDVPDRRGEALAHLEKAVAIAMRLQRTDEIGPPPDKPFFRTLFRFRMSPKTLERDPWMAPLRDDPARGSQFRAILRKLQEKK